MLEVGNPRCTFRMIVSAAASPRWQRSSPLKETSLSNSLYANTGRAIDLGSDGPTGVALVEFYDLRN